MTAHLLSKKKLIYGRVTLCGKSVALNHKHYDRPQFSFDNERIAIITEDINHPNICKKCLKEIDCE